jgi:Fe-S oxidoreductase
VLVPGVIDSGRTRISQGLLDEMPPLIRRNLDVLKPFLEAGLPVVGLEPSEVLTFRDEYADLCPDGELEEVERLGASSFLLEEFVADRSEPVDAGEHLPEVALHGHCHAKALGTADRVEAALRAFGYRTRAIPAGCCGMAGSFGYGEGTAGVSREIAGLKLLPFLEQHREAIEKGELVVCAHGFSCRHQIGDLSGLGSVHPATLLARAASAATSADRISRRATA